MPLNLAPAESMKSMSHSNPQNISWAVYDHDAGWDNHDKYRWHIAQWPLFVVQVTPIIQNVS
jgi:hypothetical protein